MLKASLRENVGSLAAKKIKKQGLIPAVIYHEKANINVSLDQKEFEQEYFKGIALTSIIELDIAGKKNRVIAHKIELDPVTDRPVHIDFMLCQNNQPLRAKPKVNFTNQDKSPGLKKGGFLHVVKRRVEVTCEGEKSIPQSIEVDVGSLHMGSKIRANNLKLPNGVKLLNTDNFLIASIIGRGKSEDDKAANAAAAAAAGAAAPAAGAGAQPAAAAADKKPEAKK